MERSLKYLAFLAFLTLLVSHAQAQSDSLGYSYIEGGLSVIDVDGGGSEEGFNVRSSIDLSNGLYFIAAWDRVNELDLVKAGLGFHAPISSTTDWFVEASYFSAEANGSDADDARLDLGIRTALNRNLEGRVFAGFLFPDSEEYLVGADILFKFSDVLGVSLGAETIEFDVHILKANLRFSF